MAQSRPSSSRQKTRQITGGVCFVARRQSRGVSRALARWRYTGVLSVRFQPTINRSAMQLNEFVRAIPDFPKPGILFRDITPLLASPVAFREAIRQLADHYRNDTIDIVAAAEARGFIFAAPLAIELKAGFVPIRKPGKLPFDTHAFHYELEYGHDSLEIHVDGVAAGQRVLVVDDLLATGGTVAACCHLIEKAGAKIVGCAFLIELRSLSGAARIAEYRPFSILRYD